MKVGATVHGAISLVNAIAAQKGATLGIELKTEATVEADRGSGFSLRSEHGSISSRLVNSTVSRVITKRDLERNRIKITINSEIPAGYGLKSSSAISSAVALACARIFRPKMTDQQILLAGVEASIESKVSLTGAYDDACSCYYGGFNVTDNARRKRIRYERGPVGISAVIFIPRKRRRGNIKNLKSLLPVFERAWDLAKMRDYWGAMTINGLATSAVLDSDPKLVPTLIKKGALAASVSGNGPSVAAIAKNKDVSVIKKALATLDGNVIISAISNTKAEAYDL